MEQWEPDWDLFDFLAESGAHGSLLVATLPNSAAGVTRLILLDKVNPGEKLATFWLLNNVLVRFSTGLGQPRESFWLLSSAQLDRLRALIAGLAVQYNQG